MYGSRRITLIDQVARAADRVARAGRLIVRLVTAQQKWGVTDLYAAACTARFMAAHELIERAADLDDGEDTTLVAARTAPWFGADYIYEETQR